MSREHSRRTFLKTSVATGACIGLAGVVLTSNPRSAFAKVIKKTPAEGVVTVTVEEFDAEAKDGAAKIKIEGVEKVLLVKHEDETYTTMSIKCTHEGCSVKWAPSEEMYNCPCHQSAFDLEGNPTGGPAQEPLTSYETSEADGVITITIPA